MLNNFIYSKTKDLFLEQLEAGHVLDEAVTFIEDTKEIWNHGTYFDGTNVREYAFPKTGGLITGVSSYPLQLKSSSDIYSTIRFITNNDDYITFGFKNSDNPQLFFTNKNGWDNEYFLYHSGNFNPSDYLSLSGGTVKGDIQARNFVFGTYNDITWGKLVIDDSVNNRIYYVDKVGTYNALLHSGNVGEYNAGSANALTLEAVGDLNSVSDNRAFYSYFQASNRPSSNYATGISLKQSDTLGYKYQLVFDTNGGLFTRHYTLSWQPWKTIAFTDSDVNITFTNEKGIAGTTVEGKKYLMLYLSNLNNLLIGYHTSYARLDTKIYGNNVYLNYGTNHDIGFILNPSGNVTIGASDLTTKGERLYVNGVLGIHGLCNTRPTLTTMPQNGLVLYGWNKNYGMSQWVENSGNSFIQSGSLGSDNLAYNLVLQPLGGNVLIGTTDDNGSGARLQVAGDITINGISLLEKLTNIEQSSDTLEDYVQENRSKSTEAINTANTAKNAVATLEGLANATTAQTTLAATVTQIEQNTTDIKVLQDMYVLMTVAEYEALEIKDSDKIYMLYEE